MSSVEAARPLHQAVLALRYRRGRRGRAAPGVVDRRIARARRRSQNRADCVDHVAAGVVRCCHEPASKRWRCSGAGASRAAMLRGCVSDRVRAPLSIRRERWTGTKPSAHCDRLRSPYPDKRGVRCDGRSFNAVHCAVASVNLETRSFCALARLRLRVAPLPISAVAWKRTPGGIGRGRLVARSGHRRS
jgi:hypothetical protein